jgi:hypothetical protein
MTAIAQETSVNELVTRATAQLLEKEGVEVVPRVRQENAAVG